MADHANPRTQITRLDDVEAKAASVDSTALRDGAVANITEKSASYASDGAIGLRQGVAYLTKTSAGAYTIADPAAGDDDKVLTIMDMSGHAHVVTYAVTGFNGGGAGSDAATFGGAKGDCMILRAKGSVWYTEVLKNVTLG